MLQENILGNNLLLDNLAMADILADIAVFAYFRINAGVGLFIIDGKVRAVSLAVTAKSAACGAILGLLGGSVLRGTGNHFDSLIRNNGNKMLGAGICTIAAANALIGINLSNAVNKRNSIIAANSNALTVTEAACCAHSLFPQLELSGILAAFNTHLVENNSASAVAAAADKGNTALKLGQVMEFINNDLLAALNGAGNTANTLFIVNYSVIIHNGNRALGAGPFALTAGNAAITANLSDKLIVFFGRRARNEVCCVGRNHADKLLGANSLFGAIAAAIAFLPVYNNLSVNELHSTPGAAVNTGTDTNASVLALPSLKAHLYSFGAGLALCKTKLSGSASGAGNKSNLLYLLHCTIRFH